MTTNSETKHEHSKPPRFKFAHDAYLVSEFKAKANAFAKAAYLDLLCYAMKQTPALSLPNDDNVLAGWQACLRCLVAN